MSDSERKRPFAFLDDVPASTIAQCLSQEQPLLAGTVLSGLSPTLAAKVLAPPLWIEIERMSESEQAVCRTLRQVYSSLLVNGPFTIIVAPQGEMIGLTDRIRLRPLTAASKDSRLYLSSEEAPIRLISPELDRVWTPVGGEPVVGRLGSCLQVQKTPTRVEAPTPMSA